MICLENEITLASEFRYHVLDELMKALPENASVAPERAARSFAMGSSSERNHSLRADVILTRSVLALSVQVDLAPL